MEFSSPRFIAFTVSIGISFWFLIFTTVFNVFSIEIFAIFLVAIFGVTQIFSEKLSKIL